MDYLQYQKYFKKSIDILGQVVLNLIINGLPSIQNGLLGVLTGEGGFKPYYKWITFNTSTRN